MTDVAYDYGLDALGNGSWLADTYKWLLIKGGGGYTPNKDHHFVADLVPASNECGQAGYARVTASTKTRTVSTALDRCTYGCANPAFGSIAVGDNIVGAVLFKFVTNDADSILVGYYAITSTPTDGNPFTPIVNAAGVAYDDQGA